MKSFILQDAVDNPHQLFRLEELAFGWARFEHLVHHVNERLRGFEVQVGYDPILPSHIFGQPGVVGVMSADDYMRDEGVSCPADALGNRLGEGMGMSGGIEVHEASFWG